MEIHFNRSVIERIKVPCFVLTAGHYGIWKEIASELKMPMYCGEQMSAETKYFIVKFLQEQGIRIVAYGDSMNDYYMLKQADEGYLIAKADGTLSRSLKYMNTEGMESSKILCNLIKAEISGNRGEYKTFKTLEYLQSQNRVMRNVELSNGETRTEIDALVITPKCLTIVEVKNTSKNILIDEDGNYYRTGEFLKWDCNIAEKMAVKEELLRKVLESVGYGHIRIRSVVVFTNNRIEVQNKFAQLRTCFVNHLAYVIDGFRLEEAITMNDMDCIQNAVENAMCQETYPFEFDAHQYQADFANLLATLEFAKVKAETQAEMVAEYEQHPERVRCQIHNKVKKVSFADVMRIIFTSKQVRYAGSTAAAVAITVVSGIIAANTVSKGGF